MCALLGGFSDNPGRGFPVSQGISCIPSAFSNEWPKTDGITTANHDLDSVLADGLPFLSTVVSCQKTVPAISTSHDELDGQPCVSMIR